MFSRRVVLYFKHQLINNSYHIKHPVKNQINCSDIMSANYKFVNSFYLYNDFSGKLIIKSWKGKCKKKM